MTAGQLIEILQDYPPDRDVGIKAACCHHVHDIDAVREPEDDIETSDGDYIVLECG